MFQIVVLDAEKDRDYLRAPLGVTLPICTSGPTVCVYMKAERGGRVCPHALSVCLGVYMQWGGSLRISGRRIRVSVGHIRSIVLLCVFGLGVYCVCVASGCAGSSPPALGIPKWQ